MTASADLVDVVDLVAIVVIAKGVTGAVTLAKAKRVGRLESSRRRSVVDSAEVVARHRLRDLLGWWIIASTFDGLKG